MKVNRKLVIKKLEARVARTEKRLEADRKKHAKANEKLAERVDTLLKTAATAGVGSRAYTDLCNAQNEYARGPRVVHSWDLRNAEAHIAMVKREISLLQLSTEEDISIRVNSDLAALLS